MRRGTCRHITNLGFIKKYYRFSIHLRMPFGLRCLGILLRNGEIGAWYQVEYVPEIQQLCLRHQKTDSFVFGDPHSAHKATVLTTLLSLIQQSLLSKLVSINILFWSYSLFKWWCHKVMFDLSCILGCSRGHLDIFASSKSLFVVQVTLIMGTGEEICGRPCAVEPMAIPIHLENIKKNISKYEYIVVVKKRQFFII